MKKTEKIEKILPYDPDFTEKKEPKLNKYYMSVASGYKIAQVLTLLLLVVFLLFMIFANGDQITYDNFKYLLKDIDTVYSSPNADRGNFQSIVYEEQSDMHFALFRGDLAVLGGSKISLFNTAGAQMFSHTALTAAPMLEVSDEYMLAYDLGGKDFRLYNSFTPVLETEADYAVYGADIADNGAFILTTKARESKFSVVYYSAAFIKSAVYYKDKYVMDAAIRGDGEEIAILSMDAVSGEFVSEIMICEKGKDTVKGTVTLEGIFPISIEYIGNDGHFVVICDDRLLFYDAELNQASSYIAKFTVQCVSVTDEGAAAVCSTNSVGSENIVLLFDTEGNIIYNNTVKHHITDLTFAAGRLYLLTSESVIRITLPDGQKDPEAEVTYREGISGAVEILTVDGESAVVCTSSAAYSVFGKDDSLS